MTGPFARACLTARRLIERGVRFVQVWSGAGGPSNNWDNHSSIVSELPAIARTVDQPIAALLSDLKARGLLEDTLVVWCTEFGRQPFSQGSVGRDHNGAAVVLFAIKSDGNGLRLALDQIHAVRVDPHLAHVRDLRPDLHPVVKVIAGEAGRGFAVVASEVKALAEQTAKATGEIGQQISGIQAAKQESVSAIREISGTIERLAEIASTIAAAVEEQGAATQEISRNVQQAAQGTHQVSSNVTEVQRGSAETGSASSQVLSTAKMLASDSTRLKDEVGKFLRTVRAA